MNGKRIVNLITAANTKKCEILSEIVNFNILTSLILSI